MNQKKISLLILGILLIICITIGFSYAVWSLNLKQSGTNIITTGCFNVTFSEINPINLTGAFPIKEEEGRNLTPYEFTIKNTCDSKIMYQINLEILNTTTFTELGYLRGLLNEKGKEDTSRLLTQNTQVLPTLDNASSSYKLNTGILFGQETKTFELRLWMDEDTEAIDSVMNKTLNSKITIVSSYEPPVDTTNMMKMRFASSNNEMWWEEDFENYDSSSLTDNYEFMENQFKIVFQKEMNPIEGAEGIDISYNNDKSVMAYNTYENGYPVTYIQANGEIKFPEISAYLFYNHFELESMEGLENVNTKDVISMRGLFYSNNVESLDLSYLDTSKVRDMWGMFQYAGGLSTLDLTGLDTSNVTDMGSMFRGMPALDYLDLTPLNTENVQNMSRMFNGMNGLTTIDLSNINTSEVRDMNGMFSEIGQLTTLDLSNFDTSNVTNMNYMFGNSTSIQELILTNFDTSSVTDMNSMFVQMYNLTNLDISSFNTKNVRNMGSMFEGLNNVAELDLSSFNTRKVTDMSAMFSGASELNTITYGSNFVYQNNADVLDMYNNCPANKPTDPSWEGVL